MLSDYRKTNLKTEYFKQQIKIKTEKEYSEHYLNQ